MIIMLIYVYHIMCIQFGCALVVSGWHIRLFSTEVMTNAKWVQMWFQVANMIPHANVGANCPAALSATLKARSQMTMAAATWWYFRTCSSQWSLEHVVSFKFNMFFCMCVFTIWWKHMVLEMAWIVFLCVARLFGLGQYWLQSNLVP